MDREPSLAGAAVFDPSAVCHRLREEIDAWLAHDGAPQPLSEIERAERIAEINTGLLAAERHEEALIETASDIPRRPDADPRAVLGVEIVSVAAKAA